MAIEKRHLEILQRLDRIEELLAGLAGSTKASKTAVTKEQLMEIKGVGEATAKEILKLVNS
jgi:endonuclease III-like uncharacterized protein